jgi:DAACS family dicarboxylate/amino acid:cation (Na+ or H+) symporter
MTERITTEEKKGGMGLATRIMIGLLLGALVGVVVSSLFGTDNEQVRWFVKHIASPLGNLWLRLLMMIVMPLVLSALILGVAGMGDIRKLGRVGLRTLAYTVVISAISVVIGISLVNLVRPGERISAETTAALQAEYGDSTADKVGATEAAMRQRAAEDVPVITQVVETLVPLNPVSSMTGTPNLLHIMFFALVLGMAATLVPKEAATPFLGFFEGLYEISVVVINGIMRLAPFAVTLLVFSSIASFGIDLLVALLWFIAVVLGGLAIHFFVVYGFSVRFLSGISPLEFFRRVRTTAITAFSTSSSNATLPTALHETHTRLGVPKDINSFVLTIGSTANQNGTALYEGVTIMFLAQLAGVDLSLMAQLTVAYLAILGGIGTAGVPGGSIPYVIVVLASLGIDPALIAIILGTDRILDMCRTVVNVIGDVTAATYVAHAEGHKLLGEGTQA